MTDRVSRRDWLKSAGIASMATFVPLERAAAALRSPWIAPVAEPAILDLHSTTDVFIPPQGDAWMKFSFEFPEPAITVHGHRFSFLLFTAENTYGLDRTRMRTESRSDGIALVCDGLVWAGGQQTEPGKVTVEFSVHGDSIGWRILARMDRPIKSITTVIRDVPRGPISLGGGAFKDAGDADVVGGYPFCAGDLHGDEVPTSMSTPLAVVRAAEGDFWFISMIDSMVRPKRFYFQAGPRGYRVEAVYEH
ncbi:MAG TPA: hypothetical protein VMS45_07415, partial [Gemmatimonadaceae bacterium]|nr:hypothetical protein [Gemmatimonadaceae bacterium]